MASEVVMPRLGWTMEVGRVVEWLKQDGDPVEAGEFIFLVETEKAVTEVEALDSGILRIPPDAPAVGEDVEVGKMLAWIVPAGEAAPFAADAPVDAPEAPLVAASAAPVDLEQEVVAAEVPETMIASMDRARAARPAISPRARRTADALGVDWTVMVGSGSGGRIVERDVVSRAG